MPTYATCTIDGKKSMKILKLPSRPKRVLGELNKTSTVLRDLLSASFTSIHVNDSQIAEEIKDYLQKGSARHKTRL